MSVNGDSFAWTPGYEDERASACYENAVEEAEKLKIRDSGYLIIKFALDVDEDDSCSDSDLPWAWVCQDNPKGRVSVVDMWLQLNNARPFLTDSGSAEPHMVDNYVVYAAIARKKYAVPSWQPSYAPVWTPNYQWGWTSNCEPKDPCWEWIPPVKPATALLKIFATMDVAENGEQVVFDLISGDARQTPLNRIIGRDCCTAEIFYPQTFKGGLISLGSQSLPGAVTQWYSDWEFCPENLILCLDLRIDTAMTQAHNKCAYTPDAPGGGCATPGATRGGFNLW